MLDNYANLLGVPEDQLRLILLMLTSYPLGLINYYLKNPTIRLWYGLITGFILQYLMYNNAVIHTIAATIGTYLFICYLGRKVSAFWVLGLTVLHLSALHIYRMIQDWGGWSLDVTTIYMMSICKFSALAFSFEDGDKKEEEFKSSYLRAKKVEKRPSLLEIFSYIFYFPSAVCGPSFEFADFRNFINLQGPFKNIPKLEAIKSAFLELLKSLINITIVLFLLNPFDFNYCITAEYAIKPFWYKFLYFNLSYTIHRTKYYGGWKMAQSCIVFCGLGYNPEEKNSNEISHKFDRIQNVVIKEVEIESNPKKRMQFWNRTVHLWLKYNLYLRLLNVKREPFKNSRGLASLITFMVSAFWHGFYPVYYVFFFLFYMIEQICTILEEDYNLFIAMDNKNIILKLLFSFFTMTFHNNLGIVFTLLDLNKAWTFTKNTYCLYPFMIFALYFFLSWQHKKIKKRKKEETGGLKSTHESVKNDKKD